MRHAISVFMGRSRYLVGEVAPLDAWSQSQPSNDFAIEAAGCEEQRLRDDGTALIDQVERRGYEDDRAIRVCRLASGNVLDAERTAADRAGKPRERGYIRFGFVRGRGGQA